MPVAPGLNDKQMLATGWQLLKIIAPGLLSTAKWLLVAAACCHRPGLFQLLSQVQTLNAQFGLTGSSGLEDVSQASRQGVGDTLPRRERAPEQRGGTRSRKVRLVGPWQDRQVQDSEGDSKDSLETAAGNYSPPVSQSKFRSW